MKIVGVFFCSLIFILMNNYSYALAEDRLFLNLNLEFLAEYELTDVTYQNTKVGGFSGITYNPQENLYYLISDDRSYFSPARFYTAKININNNKINDIKIENVTYLKNEKGNNYPLNSSDTEGIAFSPRKTLFISSEGLANEEIPPFIQEFDLDGNLLNKVRIPERYIPEGEEKKGIENNLGFESLTIKANGFMNQEPFRLFTATESALAQDIDLENPETFNRSRLMHYVINPFGEPVLVAEHLYIMDEPSFGTLYHGIPDLLTLPLEGYLLSIERSFGMKGYEVKIFQIVMANANDISSQKTLAGNINNLAPIRKKLLLDLSELDIELDNLEGLTFGPRLEDGSQSLIIVSDNNFAEADEQKNQFLLFKLTGL
jgi:hypothetical protein